jgi:hypothetical protein
MLLTKGAIKIMSAGLAHLINFLSGNNKKCLAILSTCEALNVHRTSASSNFWLQSFIEIQKFMIRIGNN